MRSITFARKGKLSMDGRGRALDNIFVERLWRSIKHEDVYLEGYGTLGDLPLGLAQHCAYDNDEWPHQSLNHRTPNAVYEDGLGGEASIPDRFGESRGPSPVSLRCAGMAPAQQQGSAVPLQAQHRTQLKLHKKLS